MNKIYNPSVFDAQYVREVFAYSLVTISKKNKKVVTFDGCELCV